MENFIQTIESLPVSKSGIEAIANQVLNNIRNSEVRATDAMVYIKSMSELCKTLEKNDEIKSYVLDELNGGTLDVYGSKVATKKSCTYDYTCSMAWCEVDSEIAKLTEKRKELETALKNASALTPFIDPSNGEVITECEKETEKVTIAVTLKK